MPPMWQIRLRFRRRANHFLSRRILAHPKPSERYEFVERLGEGSFGIVFKAYDRELRRFVAIKTPKTGESPLRADLFLREARAASQLHHPNIVSIHDVIQRGNHVHIVSEFIDGESLRLWMDQEKPSIDECCRICQQVCLAVDYAHERGIVHRDIKPANIVMDRDGIPHLLDFGLSYSRNQEIESIGSPGQPIGTPAFMAPEQVRGDTEQVNRCTDVYAIGILLYQLLTRQLPFQGRSSQLFQKILESPPPRLCSIDASIPAPLEAICLKALEKNAADRYTTALSMANDLENYLQGKIVSAYGRHDARSLRRMARRQFATGISAIFGTSLLGTSWWIWKRNAEDNPKTQVVIDVEPSNTSIYFDPISELDGYPDDRRREELIGSRPQWMPPGFYRVTLEHGEEQLQVYRTIPRKGDQAIGESTGVPLAHRRWSERNGVTVLPALRFRPLAEVQDSMTFQAEELCILIDRCHVCR